LTAELRMHNIVKTFGPVTALQGVSFSARPGTVHALCGENGAGKSTLMKILAGVYQPDAGEIFIDGQKQVFSGPRDALNAGISMLYQELDLAEHLSVYENLFLGRPLRCKLPFVIDRKAMIEQTLQYCRRYGFDLDPLAAVRTLTTGQCQIVELLKALMRRAKILVMDEPTSSLSEAESERLFEIIHQLRQLQLTIIYISHRMEEVKRLADEISVLRDGQIVASGPAAQMDIPTVVRYMVGRELKDYYPARKPSPGSVLFEAENLKTAERIQGISFSVRAGEIVGMAGLVGAGRTETARAVFGVQPLEEGCLRWQGKPLNITSPADAIQQGIAYLTEDRKRNGLCLHLPCAWNMTLPNYPRIGMRFLLRLRKEYQLCEEYGRKVALKWPSPLTAVHLLSGGNQQKLLIARWLMAHARFLIVDEPTRGIDVGAKRDVYRLLAEQAEQGKAILMISSELPELFGLCDRILVMRRGRLAADLPTRQTSPEEVMHYAAVQESPV